MSALEQPVGGPAIEVVAKATRRRFTVEYTRKIVPGGRRLCSLRLPWRLARAGRTRQGASLLPKVRDHFAEFLNQGSLVRLGLLDLSTCVGLGYGR